MIITNGDQRFEIQEGFFVVLLVLHKAQNQKNNKISLLIRKAYLNFELLIAIDFSKIFHIMVFHRSIRIL